MKKIIFLLLISIGAYGQVKISDYPKTTNTADTSNYIPLIQRYGSGWKNYRMSVGLFSLPSQTGNSGKYLTTNGTSPSWASVNSAIWGNITGTLSNQTDLQSALDGKQPLDGDLTTIAGLTPTTNNFIVSVGSAWASRTPTQVKSTLAIANTDVSGLGTLATLNTINNSNWSGTALADGNIASSSTWNAKQNAITFGTGVQTALGVNIGSIGAPVLYGSGLAGVNPLINSQSGTSYTLVLSDNGGIVEMTNASASTVTIPLNASVAFPTSPAAQITIYSYGAGGTSVSSSATIRSSSGSLTIPQYSSAVLEKRGTDEWYLENGTTITGQPLTKTDDTNVTLTLGGSPSTALLNPASLTLGWTGTLSAARGGTGSSVGAWLASGTTTLGGASTITGSSTNTITFNSSNLGTTITAGAGLLLQNPTSAGAGAQQISGILSFIGQGWKTTATAGSQPVEWDVKVLPVQGTTSPTSQIDFTNTVNGVAQVGGMSLASNGAYLTTFSTGLKISASGGAGIHLSGGTPIANTISTASGFSLSNPGNVSAAATVFTFATGTANHTSGLVTAITSTSTFQPTSGSGAYDFFTLVPTINQTGGANGTVAYFRIKPSRNAVVGTEYGFVIEPTQPLNGAGTATPIATWHINGSTGQHTSTSSAASLTLDKTATWWVFTGTTSTWTLPSLSGNTDLVYYCYNRGSGNLTIQRAGADNLYQSGASVTSITVAAGAAVHIANDGSFWLVK